MKKLLVAMSAVLAFSAFAQERVTEQLVGACANGQAYEIKVCKDCVASPNGVMNQYEYKGPLGTGSIPSKVSEATAIEHVCKQTNVRWLPDDNFLGE
jgi:hypothetical protein